MTQDDKVFEQLEELTETRMDSERKLAIRDELHRQMAAERRPRTGRGWRQKFGALAPIGVGSAALALAGAGIVAIVTDKSAPALTSGPVTTTLRQTAGSVAASPSGNTFATNNTWFYITVVVLVVAMVLLFVTRHREARKVWVQEILDLLRAPILWGLVLGVVVGVRGIPVTVYSSHWVWEQPSGFYVVSVAGLVAIGFLFGAAIQFARRKFIAGHLAFWGLAFPAAAMLLGMVAFYRGQAQTEATLWGLASTGLEHVDGVGLSLPGHTSRTDWQSYGAQIIQAADDLGAVSQYAGRYGINGNLYTAASALDAAGYTLVTSNDPQKLKQAEDFTRQAAAMVHQVAVAAHGNVNSQNIPQLVDEIAKIAPGVYQSYIPN